MLIVRTYYLGRRFGYTSTSSVRAAQRPEGYSAKASALLKLVHKSTEKFIHTVAPRVAANISFGDMLWDILYSGRLKGREESGQSSLPQMT